ncbi:hypothetical protein SprV_0902656100 [Sparganum proliferum]
MHPDHFLTHRMTEKSVGHDGPVSRAGSQEEQAIFVEAVETMGTQHSSPGSVVCADVGIVVAKDNQLMRIPHRRQEGVQVLVEFVPCCVRAGGAFASPERLEVAQQAIVYALRQTGQSSHDVGLDGKGDARVPSLCLVATALVSGVACTRLFQLTFVGKPGLAESSDVHLLARQPSEK